jgi:hypothetical protein
MKTLAVASLALFVTLVGCVDERPCDTNATGLSTCGSGGLITLTANQAAALVSRVESFGSSDPTLQALADTIGVVIRAGAEARVVSITNSQGGPLFYAVSLHRTNAQSNPPSSTYHIIAFDDPTNPTMFVILGGFNTGSGSTPPNTVSGPIGATTAGSLTGHLFSISGNQLSSWHASGGTSYMTAGATTQVCAGTMDASFTITASVAGNGTTGTRTWSGDVTSVPGIRLGN